MYIHNGETKIADQRFFGELVTVKHVHNDIMDIMYYTFIWSAKMLQSAQSVFIRGDNRTKNAFVLVQKLEKAQIWADFLGLLPLSVKRRERDRGSENGEKKELKIISFGALNWKGKICQHSFCQCSARLMLIFAP